MISTNKTSSSPQITITPDTALIDERVRITLSGFVPNLRVTLRAQTVDDAGKAWASQATFITDEEGMVDVGLQQPVMGTYHDSDAMGLFWSMSRTQPLAKKQSPLFVKTKLSLPTTITLTAVIDEEIVATAKVERLHIAQGVQEIPVREEGLIGTLYQPAGPGPHPGLLVFSGSDGLIRDRGAALLASHGYAALALVYFGSEGVPRTLASIPLEYFEKGIQWLQKQSTVVSDKIGVVGTSRGGELVLLLGTTFPQIKAVVSSAPSSLVYGSVNPRLSAWTYRGKPIPAMTGKASVADIADVLWSLVRRKPFVNRVTFEKGLINKQRMELAAIPVEKIQGPVLLISGEDDKLWPSSIFADMVVDRLAKHNFPYPYKHLKYKGAGHFVGIPYAFPNMPPMIEPLPVGPLFLAFGGNPRDSAFADADSWINTLAFLEESLGTPQTTEAS